MGSKTFGRRVVLASCFALEALEKEEQKQEEDEGQGEEGETAGVNDTGMELQAR